MLLIVNTAFEGGFTPQYKGLQVIFETYQEPGSEEEIIQFCKINYGVTFPMVAKVSVKGDDNAPLFKYLTIQENPDLTSEIGWNFEKFLIDRNGNLVRRFKSKTEYESEELLSALKEYL